MAERLQISEWRQDLDASRTGVVLVAQVRNASRDVLGNITDTVDTGAYVLGTLADGPAEGAGIGEGDVIVSVDGQAVRSPEDLGDVLDGLRPGDQVAVEIVDSGGETRTVEVELAARPLPVEIP